MIYFDEAGNSGGNLLDKNQPTFVLASHNFTADETAKLLAPIKAISNADELHFKNLKKFQKFRNAIVEIFNHELIKSDRIYHYFAHKQFMVAIQLVDQLIEPVLYGEGIDIYQYGSNLATANMLHILGTVAWKTEYDKVCELFVKWVRSRSHHDCVEFYESVIGLQQSTQPEFKDILTPIILSTQHLGTITSNFDKYTLDATLSCFVDHCNFWAKIYGKPFDITFDNSKQIDYWRDMIDFLTHSLPTAEVGYGSRKHKYPLLVNSLKIAASHDSESIQLADLFASSLNYIYTNWAKEKEDDFSKRLQATELFKLTNENKMWPTKKVTPEELDMTEPSGVNALDFIANAATIHRERYDKARNKK
ncbi:DUF3800 domain-containing protein [Mucilaginibacter flavus]|uniref:DUF3800 domain-containing protein n=1 Tax=Mucilaginibacter flavus TaxID=931504 RepID=UPI0025B4D269|nr:DUF3800 domain-containing protein [Mucilaginibacter flavus]MDN3584914.1 DUF3800 domain-containing protein [Mucilaginibacter flavus]